MCIWCIYMRSRLQMKRGHRELVLFFLYLCFSLFSAYRHTKPIRLLVFIPGTQLRAEQRDIARLYKEIPIVGLSSISQWIMNGAIFRNA